MSKNCVQSDQGENRRQDVHCQEWHLADKFILSIGPQPGEPAPSRPATLLKTGEHSPSRPRVGCEMNSQCYRRSALIFFAATF